MGPTTSTYQPAVGATRSTSPSCTQSPADPTLPGVGSFGAAPSSMTSDQRDTARPMRPTSDDSLTRPEAPLPPGALPVEVVWGDITEVDADVYAIGHYHGVLPQHAEWALDTAVSGVRHEAFQPEDNDRLVLTKLTRRGVIRGQLGDVELYPWAGRREHRMVAVCGMGNPGTFDQMGLRRLYRSLAWTLMALPAERTVCTVLIGTGEGTLTVEAGVRSLLAGLDDARQAQEGTGRIVKLIVCELIRSRAEHIHQALTEAVKHAPGSFELADHLGRAPGGRISTEQWLALLADATGRAADADEGSAASQLFDQLVEMFPPDARDVQSIRKALDEVRSLAETSTEVVHLARARRDLDHAESRWRQIPTRISFVRDGKNIRAAAITNTTTVSERIIEIDPTLIQEGVRRMTRAKESEVPHLSELVYRLALPRDFRGVAAGESPVVVEVDRDTAAVHWEMLALGVEEGISEAAGLRRPMARQLRTTYSPGAISGRPRDGDARALVIGDPGDPANQMSLPGAREEALAVRELLAERLRGGEVVLLLGAPTGTAGGIPDGIAPATRLDVLGHLLTGDFDLVHFSGHGTYDPADPTATGWVFQDGLLTAREVERIDRAPSLIVANACLTGQASRATTHPGGVDGSYGEAGLLPSLADEFFKRGVRNYIGTAWQVPDRSAVTFATSFYEAFLPSADGRYAGTTIGEAMLAARRRLHETTPTDHEAVWAAYHHYGDPGFVAREL